MSQDEFGRFLFNVKTLHGVETCEDSQAVENQKGERWYQPCILPATREVVMFATQPKGRYCTEHAAHIVATYLSVRLAETVKPTAIGRPVRVVYEDDVDRQLRSVNG